MDPERNLNSAICSHTLTWFSHINSIKIILDAGGGNLVGSTLLRGSVLMCSVAHDPRYPGGVPNGEDQILIRFFTCLAAYFHFICLPATAWYIYMSHPALLPLIFVLYLWVRSPVCLRPFPRKIAINFHLISLLFR
jgi:hypothetical protein